MPGVRGQGTTCKNDGAIMNLMRWLAAASAAIILAVTVGAAQPAQAGQVVGYNGYPAVRIGGKPC